ncbi:MAG TPA: hypothetical protein VL614_21770 [Acetobacteraceae bacterium]|jgi:hypothetical protein|nr:hypothetical protein [Acetobacteraceae bacterium]
MANHYVLHGDGIQIVYTVGGNPGFTALSFTEGSDTTNFTASQVTTDTTGLGTLVSVALVQSVDTGGTRFGFFLPDVQVTLGQQVSVATIGMFEMFGGPNSVPRRPATWQCVHLRGTAQEVEVAL